MTTLPFGEYLPDLPEIDNPGALTAENVYPAEGFYRPFRNILPYSNSLSGRCLGAFTARDTSGLAHIFAGENDKIWKLSAGGTSWVNVSGQTYGATNYVSFTQFGDTVLYANGSEKIQKYNLTSDTSFSLVHSTAPIAAYIGVVKDFLVGAKISSLPQRVQWPSIDTTGPWTTDAATQADSQDVVGDHGDITGFVGGDFGRIFFQRAIARMDYTGPPLVFNFQVVERQRGTRMPGSIASIGYNTFFAAEDGFYVFNGSQAIPIGQGKIDRTFLNDFNQSYEARVTSGIDSVNKIYACAYPSNNSADGTPDKVMLIHWPTGRWARATIMVEAMFPAVSSFGTTLDGLDALYPAGLDSIPFSLDSAAFQSGGTIFGAFNTGHRFGFFTGATLAATIDTKEGQIFDGHRAIVISARPMIDGGSPSISVGVRDKQTSSVSFAMGVSENAIGECPQRINGRYHRGRLTTTAGQEWTKAMGIDFTAVPEGKR